MAASEQRCLPFRVEAAESHVSTEAHMAAAQQRRRPSCVQIERTTIPGVFTLPNYVLENVLKVLVAPWGVTEGVPKHLAANMPMNKITETHPGLNAIVAASKSLTRCFVVFREMPPVIPHWCSRVIIRDEFGDAAGSAVWKRGEKLARRCHGVSAFYLDECHYVTDSLIKCLFLHCPSMTSLDVHGSEDITDKVFELMAVSKLKHMYISECDKVRGTGVSDVPIPGGGVSEVPEAINIAAACKGLITLDLSYSGIESTVLARIGSGTLKTLLLCGSKVEDVSLAAMVEKSPNLKTLWLANCNITDAGVAAIASACHRIKSLSLYECTSISNVALKSLGDGCTAITDLDLTGCKHITKAGFLTIATKCKNMEIIHFAGCYPGCDSDRLSHILRLVDAPFVCSDLRIKLRGRIRLENMAEWPMLTTLNLDRCGFTCPPQAFYNMVAKCPNIKRLCLAGCICVGDETLDEMAAALRALRHLDLDCCSEVTNAGLASLGRWCNDIDTLNLRKCTEIGDEGMGHLAKCPKLTALDISYCTKIEIGGLKALAVGCPHITGIRINGCPYLISRCHRADSTQKRGGPSSCMYTQTGQVVFPVDCKCLYGSAHTEFGKYRSHFANYSHVDHRGYDVDVARFNAK